MEQGYTAFLQSEVSVLLFVPAQVFSVHISVETFFEDPLQIKFVAKAYVRGRATDHS